MQISADALIKGNSSKVWKSLNELFDGSLHHSNGCEPLKPEGLPPVVGVEYDRDDLSVAPRYCLGQTVLTTEIEGGKRAARLQYLVAIPGRVFFF